MYLEKVCNRKFLNRLVIRLCIKSFGKEIIESVF